MLGWTSRCVCSHLILFTCEWCIKLSLSIQLVCAACSPTTCPHTSSGQRLVLAVDGAAYYSQPCHQGAFNISQGILPKCAVFNTTGVRQASSADCRGEQLCYLPTVLGEKTYYLVDFPCGSGAGDDASAFGFVADKRCPGDNLASMRRRVGQPQCSSYF